MEKEYKKYCFKKFRKLRILRHTGECETYTQIRMESRQVRRKEKNHFLNGVGHSVGRSVRSG